MNPSFICVSYNYIHTYIFTLSWLKCHILSLYGCFQPWHLYSKLIQPCFIQKYKKNKNKFLWIWLIIGLANQNYPFKWPNEHYKPSNIISDWLRSWNSNHIIMAVKPVHHRLACETFFFFFFTICLIGSINDRMFFLTNHRWFSRS